MPAPRVPSPRYGLRPRSSVHVRGLFRPLNHRVPKDPIVIRLDSSAGASLDWGGRYAVMSVCGCFCWPDIEVDADDAELQCPRCWCANAVTADDGSAGRAPDPGDNGSADRVHGDLRAPALATPAARTDTDTAAAARPKPGSIPLGHHPSARS